MERQRATFDRHSRKDAPTPRRMSMAAMKNLNAKLGTWQTMEVIEEVAMGVYLAFDESPPGEKVLLPKRWVPEDADLGDPVQVFLYKDSEDRFIATTQTPKLKMGQIELLKVLQVTDIGAFLDWGLDKDLFLPFKAQTYEVKVDDEIPVSLYIDKSSRLCATMHLYDQLSSEAPYTAGDVVDGIIYEVLENFGAFVVVDLAYSALIPRNEIHQTLAVGSTVKARVKEVREDGKLTLSLREKAHLQMGADALVIWNRLEENEGFLPFHDKTPPEVISREFGLSKNAFKRAIGRLYKEGKLTIDDEGITLR